MTNKGRPSGKGGGKNAPLPLLIECPNNLLAVVLVYELSVLLLANLAAVLEHLALFALLQLHALARLSLVEQEASYGKLHHGALGHNSYFLLSSLFQIFQDIQKLSLSTPKV